MFISIKIIVSLLLFLLLSGCGFFKEIFNDSKPRSLCSKEILNRCGSCNPTLERLDIVAGHLDKTLFLEVKSCADTTLNASVKGVDYLNGTLKACLSKNKTIDGKTRDKLLEQLDKAKVSDEEYQQWLQCRFNNKPSVVLMDSPIDELVYCPDTRKAGASNQHDIIPLINDLDIAIHTVPTHLKWQDEQRVINLNPKLVVVHASAFYKKTKEFEGNTRLLEFLDSMKNEPGKVLVYTRGVEEGADENVKRRWENILRKLNLPEMQGKMELFIMPKGHNSCFSDPDIGASFKKKIKTMLSFN